MPGRDGTGPLGEGPLTGGGFGYCAGGAGLPRTGGGRGMAWGRGGGTGLGMANRRGQGGFRRTAIPDNVDEKTLLRRRLGVLEQSQSEIAQRLSEIEGSEE